MGINIEKILQATIWSPHFEGKTKRLLHQAYKRHEEGEFEYRSFEAGRQFGIASVLLTQLNDLEKNTELLPLTHPRLLDWLRQRLADATEDAQDGILGGPYV